jgi:hypothetical protein
MNILRAYFWPAVIRGNNGGTISDRALLVDVLNDRLTNIALFPLGDDALSTDDL